jgi:asparagine synthase (glutamine-hydrolysing)
MRLRDGRAVDPQVLDLMGGSMRHRGPNAGGHFIDPEHPSLGITSRRLAVIDLTGGDQPMSTAEGRFTIVYNGELFNTAEVRGELERRGHRFRTDCDTEVVLQGFAEWGPSVVDHLNGMWAFGVWDAQSRELFLARDRLGVKPLVYAETAEGFVFASEIKTLVASGLVERTLDTTALDHYLAFFAVPDPYSLVKDVRRLPAGHWLKVGPSGLRIDQYWDCALEEDEGSSFDERSEEIEALLRDSVERRLVSDVPIGVLLSSGVDSMLTAKMAADAEQDLHSFTLGFDVRAADERIPAAAVARRLGTKHHDDVLTASMAGAAIPDLLRCYDEPGQSLVQTYFVSELARRDVTVALSGLGGDELFASYPTHVVANALTRWDQLPSPLRQATAAVAGRMPSRRAERFTLLQGMGADDRAARELMYQAPADLLRGLVAPDLRAELDPEAPATHLLRHFEKSPAKDPLNRLLYVYVKTYLADELLRATDAMSMHHSLEIRTPFLDYRLVELAMRTPASYKLRGRKGKLVLRSVAERVLGDQDPRKRGFSPPLVSWLGGPFQEQVRDVLARPAVERRGVFDPDAVDDLMRKCFGGDSRLTQAVMAAYAFETWATEWIDGQSVPRMSSAPAPAQFDSAPNRDLSIVIVNWNTREKLRTCLSSIDAQMGSVEHEVLVIDNASSDGSPDMVERDFPHVRLIRNTANVGFGAANNQGMRAARGRWFLLLNSDTEMIDDSVSRMFTRLKERTDIGVAHCRLHFPDGRLQHSTYRFPSLRLALLEDLGFYKFFSDDRRGELLLAGYWDQSHERDVDWVSGAFMLMPRAVFEQTGGFDERIFMYGEDMEWGLRIRDHGWRIRYFPEAMVVHYDHSSSEIRWGDERIALCLQRERDIYADRQGDRRARALVGLRLFGAVLRTAYYTVRARLPTERAEAYVPMEAYARKSLSALMSLAMGRR